MAYLEYCLQAEGAGPERRARAYVALLVSRDVDGFLSQACPGPDSTSAIHRAGLARLLARAWPIEQASLPPALARSLAARLLVCIDTWVPAAVEWAVAQVVTANEQVSYHAMARLLDAVDDLHVEHPYIDHAAPPADGVEDATRLLRALRHHLSSSSGGPRMSCFPRAHACAPLTSTPVSHPGDPVGVCYHCHILACASHGIRTAYPRFECVLCQPVSVTGAAVRHALMHIDLSDIPGDERTVLDGLARVDLPAGSKSAELDSAPRASGLDAWLADRPDESEWLRGLLRGAGDRLRKWGLAGPTSPVRRALARLSGPELQLVGAGKGLTERLEIPPAALPQVLREAHGVLEEVERGEA